MADVFEDTALLGVGVGDPTDPPAAQLFEFAPTHIVSDGDSELGQNDNNNNDDDDDDSGRKHKSLIQQSPRGGLTQNAFMTTEGYP